MRLGGDVYFVSVMGNLLGGAPRNTSTAMHAGASQQEFCWQRHAEGGGSDAYPPAWNGHNQVAGDGDIAGNRRLKLPAHAPGAWAALAPPAKRENKIFQSHSVANVPWWI